MTVISPSCPPKPLRPQCVVVADLSALVSIPHAACCVVDRLPLVQPRPTPDNSACASTHSGLRIFSACGCCTPCLQPTWQGRSTNGAFRHKSRVFPFSFIIKNHTAELRCVPPYTGFGGTPKNKSAWSAGFVLARLCLTV